MCQNSASKCVILPGVDWLFLPCLFFGLLFFSNYLKGIIFIFENNKYGLEILFEERVSIILNEYILKIQQGEVNKLEFAKWIIYTINWIYHFFTSNNLFFYYLPICFWIKTDCSMVDIDEIFPMLSSEFMKSLNFGSI